MNSFFAALGFLTLLPAPRSVHENPEALARAVRWFPAVGLLLGALLAAAGGLSGGLLPPAVRAVLLVILWAALTRGLHMDGLADAADGLLSFRPREKMLEIMRDPRSGPMGVAAVGGVIAMKCAALYSLPEGALWKALLLAPLAGRCAMGLALGLHPYARENGLAAPFLDARGPWKAALCGLWLLAPSLLLGEKGLLAAAACLALAWGFAAWVRGKIGGYTGDTLGASCELTETAWLFLLTIRTPF